jgi:DnaJ-class molecular chaperone
MAKKQKLLSEYEAAAMVGMSPKLLRWFTSRAPKSGDPRKLKIAKEKNGVIFFEQQDLLSFNEWLRLPWPHKTGKRPNIPVGIREEIKIEANGACAICNTNGDTCEAAHLDPVSKTKCNHPEGLLNLCANHHKKYDDGRYGPDEENAEFVKGFKTMLHYHKRSLWIGQHEVGRKLFLILADCDRLEGALKKAKTPTQVKAIERIAKSALAELPKLAPVSKSDPHYKAYKAISIELSSLNAQGKKEALPAQLKQAKKIKQEYVAALGYVACPLCKASGYYDGADCPVCSGDREIEERIAERIDLAAYDNVKCPLCEGDGKRDGEDCPECGGEGEMQRRFAEQVDVSQYEAVDCPVCNGKGRFQGEQCPACHGDRQMPRYAAEQIDTSQYDEVDCPLCKGSGRHDGDDCPVCRGDRQIPRHAAEQVDVEQYRNVKCPVCKGRGQFDGDDCPACAGEGEMPRGQSESIDLAQYKKVTCPACKGRHDGCQFCNGEGEVFKGDADNFDPRDYE